MRDAGLTVRDFSEHGFPDDLRGGQDPPSVVPRGLLAVPTTPPTRRESEHGIGASPGVVNLYPSPNRDARRRARRGIENIDSRTSMVRWRPRITARRDRPDPPTMRLPDVRPTLDQRKRSRQGLRADRAYYSTIASGSRSPLGRDVRIASRPAARGRMRYVENRIRNRRSTFPPSRLARDRQAEQVQARTHYTISMSRCRARNIAEFGEAGRPWSSSSTPTRAASQPPTR